MAEDAPAPRRRSGPARPRNAEQSPAFCGTAVPIAAARQRMLRPAGRRVYERESQASRVRLGRAVAGGRR
eukprot:9711066-Lingulodinium_polyedra.AAC.1